MRKQPTPHTIYRHFKGNLYQVMCIATDSESREQMVVYQALYGDYGFYVRPLDMFMSPVDRVKYPDVKQEYRFEEVTQEESQAEIRAEQAGTQGTMQDMVSGQKSKQTELHAGSMTAGPMETKESWAEQPAGNVTVMPGEIKEAKEAPAVNISEETYDTGEVNLDPQVIEFLDADTYERRLEILTSIGYKITDDMIDIMSTVIDIDVPNGSIDKRYEDFKEALITRKRYECRRFGR